MFHAITGDETGLLKLVNVNDRSSLAYGSQSRLKSVKALSWFDFEKSFIALRVNSTVEYYDVDPSKKGSEISLKKSIDLKDFTSPVGCFSVGSPEDCSTLFFDQSGLTSIVKAPTDKVKPKESCRFDANGPISAGATSKNAAAFGGRENDVQLWDISTQKNVWKGKNVPFDSLSLRVPIYITAIKFLGNSSDANGAKLITGTGYKQLRVYDTKARRQPVVSFDIGGEDAYRVTSILPSDDGRTVTQKLALNYFTPKLSQLNPKMYPMSQLNPKMYTRFTSRTLLAVCICGILG